MIDNNLKKQFLNDLYLFYRYFIASNYSVPAPHIKTLSRKLMELKEGKGKHRLAVSMPPRHILADSTPILTYNKGWTTHGELEVGDYVFGLDGKPTEIIGVSPKKECDRLISFSNGATILAHEGHLWSVHKRGNTEKELQVLPTSTIERDYAYTTKNGKHNKSKKRYRYHLPLIEPVVYDNQDLLIDPYWLGLWLGDGTYNKPCITHSADDSHFIENVPYNVTSQTIHKDTNVYTTYFSNQNLTTYIKQLGLYENKHIPKCYKESSYNQRIQLLAGLIDSDGSVDKNGRVRFTNTNKQLIDDVYELCCGLGLYPYIIKYDTDKINEYKQKSNSLQIKSKKDCYHIGFQARYSIPTKIPRKKIIEKGLRRKIAIKKVEKTDRTEMGQCIEIENENGIYLVGKEMIPTHNSKSSMVTLAFPLWLLFQNPNVNIMIVTGSPKLAEKFGIQLREYVRDLGKYFNVYLSNVKQASTHIMFCDKNNKLYKGNIMLASSGGGITGQDADYLILDDPYTGNDSEFTPSALQQKIDWVNRVVEQRIEPHTKYCILHTRWHPISNDCPVYTSNRGWTTHGQLKVGDKVVTPNYTTATIVKVHPKVMVDNCFEFSNGDRIISGDEHLWKFHDETTNTVKLYKTSELMGKPLFVNNSYLPRFKIPLHNRYISLIKAYKVNAVEGNCITIDSKDGMYMVGRNWTPTHNSNDLIGYYKENDPESYDFVEFSAIKDNGKPLWGERYTIDDLLKKKEVVGERVFQSVYQQHPIDTTSDYFNMQHLKYGEPENFVAEASVRGWDIASSDALSNNDFTAGVLMDRFGDFAVIQDLVHGRFGGQNKKIIQSTAEADTPNVHICIETGVAGAGKLLYEEWCNQLKGFMVSQAVVSGGGSKVDRATPLQNAIEDGKVYINITDPVLRDVFYKEFQQFPNGNHDDIVDATAHCYNSLFMEGSIRRRPRAKLGIVYL